VEASPGRYKRLDVVNVQSDPKLEPYYRAGDNSISLQEYVESYVTSWPVQEVEVI
jgi:hypothetical protein